MMNDVGGESLHSGAWSELKCSKCWNLGAVPLVLCESNLEM
jgi:hypothetical protein